MEVIIVLYADSLLVMWQFQLCLISLSGIADKHAFAVFLAVNQNMSFTSSRRWGKFQIKTFRRLVRNLIE